jgi:hypothetical protein
MRRVSLAIVLAGLTLVSATHAAAQTRHSGTLLAVDAAGQSITLEELGAGPRGKGKNEVIARSIALTPETKILLVTRAGNTDAHDDWPRGFRETPVSAAELQKGDFATVEVGKRNGRSVAVSVRVVRPASAPR